MSARYRRIRKQLDVNDLIMYSHERKKRDTTDGKGHAISVRTQMLTSDGNKKLQALLLNTERSSINEEALRFILFYLQT